MLLISVEKKKLVWLSNIESRSIFLIQQLKLTKYNERKSPWSHFFLSSHRQHQWKNNLLLSFIPSRINHSSSSTFSIPYSSVLSVKARRAQLAKFVTSFFDERERVILFEHYHQFIIIVFSSYTLLLHFLR